MLIFFFIQKMKGGRLVLYKYFLDVKYYDSQTIEELKDKMRELSK